MTEEQRDESGRYGKLVGDPTEYNPQRPQGVVTAEGASVEDLLDGIEHPRKTNHSDSHNAVEKVRAFLARHRMPMSGINVYEHSTYGTVQIEKDGYLSESSFEAFRELMKSTDGIGYDGGVNFCDPEWVADLPAGELEIVEQDPSEKDDETTDTNSPDRFPCPVPSCDAGFDNVDSLAGHIGGKAPYDDAHAEYGDIHRHELRRQEVR